MLTPIEGVIERVLSVYRGWDRDVTVAKMRTDWDALFGSAGSLADVEHDEIGGVPVAWVPAQSVTRNRIFLYLHGGGYRVGSLASHADLVRRISAASDAVGLFVDYRLSPEYSFPAPIEDVLAVWDGLLERGVQVQDIVLAGDSAGGNLALAAALALRNRGAHMPAGIVLLSAWTDLACTGASYETRSAADPIHQRKMVLNMAAAYLAGADPTSPMASPVNADLTGLPPLLIQVGDRETVLSDSEDFAALASAAGVRVDLQIWPEMIHVFQQFPDALPQAREAIHAIGTFIAASPKPSKE